MLHARALQDLGECFKAIEKQLFTVQYGLSCLLACMHNNLVLACSNMWPSSNFRCRRLDVQALMH